MTTPVSVHEPAISATSRRRSHLVVLGEGQQLRACVAGDRRDVGHCRVAQRWSDRVPARDLLVADRERHVGAERPAGEHERSARLERRAERHRRGDVETLTFAGAPRTRAASDPTEVEPQRGDPRGGECCGTARRSRGTASIPRTAGVGDTARMSRRGTPSARAISASSVSPSEVVTVMRSGTVRA